MLDEAALSFLGMGVQPPMASLGNMLNGAQSITVLTLSLIHIYQQAYEGFMKAMSTEMFPMCGMDQCTVDYLLAAMAYHFKK